MASHYSKLSAIFFFAVLQCFAPLLHAHFDTKTHGLSGAHQHDVVEYCLDSSPCSEAKVEALDSPAITTARAFPKKFPPQPGPAILPSRFSPLQSQLRVSFASTSLSSITIPRPPFAFPHSQAPPYIL